MKTAEQRLDRHVMQSRDGRRCAISAALRKYGRQAFTVTVLEEHADKETLRERERHFIAELGTMAPSGYNLSAGGEGSAFWYAPVRERMSASMKKAWASPSDRRLSTINNGVEAMRAACADATVEMRRRAKISKTMRERRVGQGSSNGMAKVTPDTVRAIRARLAEGVNQTKTALEFGVSRRLVGFISKGQRWGHVS